MSIELRNVGKRFGDVVAVDDVSFTVAEGELVGLLGPSGGGKTTVLRMIAGLELPTGGDVLIGGRRMNDVPVQQRNIGFVFQGYALFKTMSVADNIAFGLRIKKWSRADSERRVAELLELFGLQGLGRRYPHQLSGGQRQRVAIARALAPKPTVLLLDEPFGAVDAKIRQELREWLVKLHHDLAVTTVFVTHDQAEALALADRIAIMDNGRIQQVGTPREVFRTPASRFVAAFIGSVPMNLLEGRIEGGDFVFGECRLAVPPSAARTAATLAPDAQVTYGARPEYVHLDHRPSEGGVGGDVRVIENLGASLQVSIGVGDQLLRAIVDEDDGPNIGDVLYATPNPNRALLFGSDGRRIDDGDTTTAGDL